MRARSERREGQRARRAAQREPRVDGGAARNDLMMQFQADVLGVRCVRPTNLETTAMGAAYLAGLGVGFWASPDAVTAAWARDRVFEPTLSVADRDIRRAAWAAGSSQGRTLVPPGSYPGAVKTGGHMGSGFPPIGLLPDEETDPRRLVS